MTNRFENVKTIGKDVATITCAVAAPLAAIFVSAAIVKGLQSVGLVQPPQHPPGYKTYPLAGKPELGQAEIAAGCEIQFVSHATSGPFGAYGWERVCKVEPGA